MGKTVTDQKKVKTVRAVAIVIVIVGFLITLSVLLLELAILQPALTTIGEIQQSISENAVRAENPDLVDARIVAATYPPMLLALSFVGIAFILSGIFIVQLGAMKALWKMKEDPSTLL